MNQKPSPLHRASEWIVDHYRLFFVVFAALLVFSAVASGWVKVENDVAAYLPADSETRQGLDIMEQEFQTYGSAKILLRDTDADAAAATAEQIRAVDGVDSCTYTMNDTGSALLSVSLSDLEGSDTCAQTVQALRDLLDGSGAYIYSAEGYSISDQINGEVRGLLVIVAIILVTVLTFTSSTYAEVPILLITFLAAALINKGTNFVFGTISFVSNAVAILLQLAMSVDYAIIFCNRYKQAHETLPVREAVIESLEKSITVISSSSLTTIAGLVAMTFMKFGLGRDLGIVLIKAILISMLTVFLLMPGLLLKLGPAMDKTKHRNFVPKISGVGRLAWRTRRVVPLVFAAVLVVACIGANRVSLGFNFETCMFVTEEKDKAMKKGHLSPFDIVLTSRGTLGNVALYDNNIPYKNVRINSGMLIIRPKTERVPPYFIYSLLKSRYMKAAIEQFRSGSAQPQLPIKDLQKISFDIPDDTTILKITNMQLQSIEEMVSKGRYEIDKLKALSRILLAELSC